MTTTIKDYEVTLMARTRESIVIIKKNGEVVFSENYGGGNTISGLVKEAKGAIKELEKGKNKMAINGVAIEATKGVSHGKN